MAEHDELVLAVGPYLLGALDPETRRAVRDHLDTCAICRDELIRLAAVPGFLAQVTPRLADPNTQPSPELRERLVSQVLAERASGRRRMQLVAAAAALVFLLPVGVFTALRINTSLAEPSGPEPTGIPQPTYHPMVPEPAAGDLQAEVTWIPHAWGVELRVQTWGGTVDQTLELVAESRDGTRTEQVAAWKSEGRRVPSVGTTSIDESDMGRILVRNEAHEELLVLEL